MELILGILVLDLIILVEGGRCSSDLFLGLLLLCNGLFPVLEDFLLLNLRLLLFGEDLLLTTSDIKNGTSLLDVVDRSILVDISVGITEH